MNRLTQDQFNVVMKKIRKNGLYAVEEVVTELTGVLNDGSDEALEARVTTERLVRSMAAMVEAYVQIENELFQKYVR